jgi:hypothetical protein
MNTHSPELLEAIDPSIYPDFRVHMLDMLARLDNIYENKPAEDHAKEFADILVEFDCVPDLPH